MPDQAVAGSTSPRRARAICSRGARYVADLADAAYLLSRCWKTPPATTPSAFAALEQRRWWASRPPVPALGRGALRLRLGRVEHLRAPDRSGPAASGRTRRSVAATPAVRPCARRASRRTTCRPSVPRGRRLPLPGTHTRTLARPLHLGAEGLRVTRPTETGPDSLCAIARRPSAPTDSTGTRASPGGRGRRLREVGQDVARRAGPDR